jgi:hypothetical protein
LRRRLGLLVVLAVAACSPAGASPVTTSPAGAKPSVSVSPLGTATILPSSTTTNLATCRVESLSITGVGQGETGVVNFGVAMTNTSSPACSLPGVPSSVELLRATGTPLELTVDPALRNATARVVLRPGVQADALLTFYWMNWCGQAPGALRVRLTFDGTPGSVTGPLHGLLLARCDSPGNPSHIQVDGIDQAGT